MITIPESFVIYINVAIIVFYVFFYIRGSFQGFFFQLLNLFGTLIAFFVAWRYCEIGSSYFHIIPSKFLPLQDTLVKDVVYEFANKMLWFLVLFILCKIVFYLIGLLVKGIQKVPGFIQISSFLGGILGLLTATIWIVVICIILNMPIFSNGTEIKKASWLSLINDKALDTIELLGIPTDSDDLVNSIYLKLQDVPDNDKEAIIDWLESNGYKELDK